MNDEIKEILDYLKEFIDEDRLEQINLNRWFVSSLLDYITNLQQENEKIRKMNMYEHKYDSDMEEKYLIEKSRIDKAIEYINENCITSDKWEDLGFCDFVPTGEINYKQLSKGKVKELLNILRGDK